jgi:hypothetical protein
MAQPFRRNSDSRSVLVTVPSVGCHEARPSLRERQFVTRDENRDALTFDIRHVRPARDLRQVGAHRMDAHQPKACAPMTRMAGPPSRRRTPPHRPLGLKPQSDGGMAQLCAAHRPWKCVYTTIGPTLPNVGAPFANGAHFRCRAAMAFGAGSCSGGRRFTLRAGCSARRRTRD